MSDEYALLAAIAANPVDRTPRLVYADWLDEHDRSLDGALQRVLAEPDRDDHRLAYAAVCERQGDSERAEFIRIQAHMRQASNERLPQHIYDREYALLEKNWHAWLGCPTHIKRRRPWVSDHHEPAINFQHRRRTRADLLDLPHTEVLFVRGFAHEVWCEGGWWVANADSICGIHPVERVHVAPEPHVTLNETHAWFTSDPRNIRVTFTDLFDEATEEERGNLDTLPAFCRLRWPCVSIELA